MKAGQKSIAFHSDKRPFIRVDSIITHSSNPNVSVLIEFEDCCGRRRWEEMPREVFMNWRTFQRQMNRYGYQLGPDGQELHNALISQPIKNRKERVPWPGWRNTKHPKYVPPGVEVRISPRTTLSFGDISGGKLSRKSRSNLGNACELTRLMAYSPAFMIALLSGLAPIAIVGCPGVVSYVIYFVSEKLAIRKLIRQVGAWVSGGQENCWAPKTPATELAAAHRHSLLCLDVPASATPRQLKEYITSLLTTGAQTNLGRGSSRCQLPTDVRLIVLATGPGSQLHSVPRSIAVSSLVDPELGPYDALPESSSIDELNAKIFESIRASHGAISWEFCRRIERHPAQFWRDIEKQIRQFVARVKPKTEEESQRAFAIGLLSAVGVAGIEWKLLLWDRARLKFVTEKLYKDACQPLETDLAVKAATDELQECLRCARMLNVGRRGNRPCYTEQQAQAAEVFVKDNYLYVTGELLVEWLGEKSDLVIRTLNEQGLLKFNINDRRRNSVQLAVTGISSRKRYYAIHISFLGEAGKGSSDLHQTADATGEAVDLNAAATAPLDLFGRLDEALAYSGIAASPIREFPVTAAQTAGTAGFDSAADQSD
jgi:hypothetical protein